MIRVEWLQKGKRSRYRLEHTLTELVILYFWGKLVELLDSTKYGEPSLKAEERGRQDR